MRQTPGDITSQLQELASRSLRQHVRNNQRFADLLKRISGGELSMQEVREELRQFSEHETTEYIRTLTTMGIGFFSGLLDLNQSFNERFFQRIGQAHPDPEPAALKTHGQLVLRGTLAETVQGRFVVENRREQVSEVAMIISPVTGRDGFQFQAPFVIEPAAFRLGTGEERAVLVTVRLHPELFKPGEQYSCQLVIRGPDLILDILIQTAEQQVTTEFVAAVVSVDVVEDPVQGPDVQQASSPATAGKKTRKARAKSPARRSPAHAKRTRKKAATKKFSSARKHAPKQNPRP